LDFGFWILVPNHGLIPDSVIRIPHVPTGANPKSKIQNPKSIWPRFGVS
jgi:hypothetical protein